MGLQQKQRENYDSNVVVINTTARRTLNIKYTTKPVYVCCSTNYNLCTFNFTIWGGVLPQYAEASSEPNAQYSLCDSNKKITSDLHDNQLLISRVLTS